MSLIVKKRKLKPKLGPINSKPNKEKKVEVESDKNIFKNLKIILLGVISNKT